MMSQGRTHVGSSLNIMRQLRAEMSVTICGSTHKTGMHFLDRIAALTNGLLQLGLRQGDVVAIAALNSDLYLEWMMAVMCAGCIVAPLNYRWSPEEALLAAGQVCPVMLVVDSFCLEWSKRFFYKIPSLQFHVLLGEEDPQETQLIQGIPPIQTIVCSMRLSMLCFFNNKCRGMCLNTESQQLKDSLIQTSGGFQDLDFRWAPDSVALICFTSGTTENPKGVAISHDALIVQSQAKIDIIGYNHNDVYLHTSPLCHIGGISSALAIVLAGGCHIFLPKFEAASAIFAIQRYSVSAMITVPTMLADIVTFCINSRRKKRESTLCFSSLEKILNGAGSLSPQLIKKVTEVFPRAQIFSAYGMTEACSSMTFILACDPIIRQGTSTKIQEYSINPANQNNFQDHPIGVCVGKPAPHVEIQIEQSNECLDANNLYNVGNILTRGPHVMLKYWGQKHSTTAALSENRWLNTGDLGWIDKEGRLWLLGRSKDMIKSGGENVYPSEVEKILLQHPGILAAVVVGIPDPRFIEIVTACIRLRDGWHWEHQNFPMQNNVAMNEHKKLSPMLLQLFCKQQGLSGFKSPRIFFPQKEPFPRTTTGKVKRDSVKREILLRLQPCSELTAARSSL
ncbi:2-succinylbenzoate--CoA ligase, chloroplastic/peroxisomal isoform X2 [Cryptomeria japonica]|uniref:2-succinylbenzoate--CoA ligase, chloroplastic/peroxisomal isoform X2 n=1 Tax=Cryptomeria japonica TaxID=3369 RepID=UPI0027DA5DAC|nr:2-succinylbenzoate--CoA ligase, chloroplastic/peroxisomal isoform X2 [Cryptomeria japonica]